MMKFKNFLKAAVLLLVLIPLNYNAQQSWKDEALKGFSKPVGPVSYNPFSENISIFMPNGEKIDGSKFIQLNNDEFSSEVYVDSDKKRQVILVTKFSDEEAAKRKETRIKALREKLSKRPEQPKKPAPTFNFTDLKGKKYSLASLKGKIVVMNFWFTTCGPCIMEMPGLNKLVEKYAGKNVVFLAVTFNDQAAVKKFLSKNEFKYNIITDSKKLIDQYQVKSYPTHIIIDKNSQIRYTSGNKEMSLELADEVDFEIEKALQ